MNPGYLSYILITLSVILVCSGWHHQAIGSFSVRGALTFVGIWLLAGWLHWESSGGMSGSFVYVPLLLLTIASYRICEHSGMERFTALTFSLLLGAVVSLVQLIEMTDPVWIIFHPFYDPLIIAGMLTLGYTRSPSLQFGIVTAGLVGSDLFLALLPMVPHREIGERAFQDAWWVTAVSVRTGSVFLAAGQAVMRNSAVRWLRRQK